MPRQDNWAPDILAAGVGLAAGLATSLGMPRASVGSFEATKAVIELLVVFVALHYVRHFVQKLPILGEIFGPVFYAIQLSAAYVIGAGLAINYLPG